MRRLKRMIGALLVYVGMAMVGFSIYSVFVVDCGCKCCAKVSFDAAPIHIDFYSVKLYKAPADCAKAICSNGARPFYVDAFLSGVGIMAMGTLLRRRGKAFDPNPVRFAH